MMHFENKVVARKVPEVALLFWVIKLLTTAAGESTSDFFVNHYNPYAVVIIAFGVFVLIMALQLTASRYVPWRYWLAVLMVAVFGTMAADVIHVVLGVPYLISTITFSVVLVAIFWLWAHTEETVSIHSITTRRREVFYWATVLATFALGTATGDLVAYAAHLGFFTAGVLFAILFIIPSIGYRYLRWNTIFTFWFAYIMTRPLGASFADWTGKASSVGGLGWGDGPVVVVLGLMILVLVGYLTITHENA